MNTDLKQRFDKFQKENPKVYEELLTLTEKAYQQGRKKFGIQMLFEIIRWNRMIHTTDPEFKINNNYAAYYARKIMAEHPKYEGMFNVRKIKGEVEVDPNQLQIPIAPDQEIV